MKNNKKLEEIIVEINDINEYDKFLKKDMIPIYVNNRKDLSTTVKEYCQKYQLNTEFNKANYYFLIGEGLEKLSGMYLKIASERLESFQSIKNCRVVIICEFESFNQDKIIKILENCKANNVMISIITGRDIQSITWMLAKQLCVQININESALLTHKRLSKGMKQRFKKTYEILNYSIFDIEELSNNDTMKIFNQKSYKKIVFHSHGKEDHINLDDFTICGKNNTVDICDLENSPRCGYGDGTCFKEDNKLIYANKLDVETAILLSCNNVPFNNNLAYDQKYNLLLNFIDGFSKNIIGAITVINVEWRDMLKNSDLLDKSNFLILNDYIESKMGFRPLLSFGMPFKYKTAFEEVEISKSIYEALNAAIRISVSKTVKDEKMIFHLDKFINLARKHVHYQNICVTQNEQNEKDLNFIERIRELDKKYAEYLLNNPTNEIFNFGEKSLSTDDKIISIEKNIECTCGSYGLIIVKESKYKCDFTTKVKFCYRCGEKKLLMEEALELEIIPLKKINPGSDLEIQIKNTGNKRMPIGCILPSYIDEYFFSDNVERLFKTTL